MAQYRNRWKSICSAICLCHQANRSTATKSSSSTASTRPSAHPTCANACLFVSIRADLHRYKAARNLDRHHVGAARYPLVYYPEMYLLEGGYRAFYSAHKVRFRYKILALYNNIHLAYRICAHHPPTCVWTMVHLNTSASPARPYVSHPSPPYRRTHQRASVAPSPAGASSGTVRENYPSFPARSTAI